MTTEQTGKCLSRCLVQIMMFGNLTPVQLSALHRDYHELQMLLCSVEEKNFRSDSHENFAIQLR